MAKKRNLEDTIKLMAPTLKVVEALFAEIQDAKKVAQLLNKEGSPSPAAQGVRVHSGFNRVTQARYNKKIWTTARVELLLEKKW